MTRDLALAAPIAPAREARLAAPRRFPEEAAGADASAAAHALARSPGQPLDQALRSGMEASLGRSFGDIRILPHAGHGDSEPDLDGRDRRLATTASRIADQATRGCARQRPAASPDSSRPRDPAGRVDLGNVLLHTDAAAARSAASLDARAYAFGNHIVFGAGQFAPQSPQGRWLLAHEIAHVAQQSSSRQRRRPVVQRLGIGEAISRFFGGGTFSEEELKTYLAFLATEKRIEDAYDSDNKAREIVRRWKRGDAAFSILTVPMRILLIKEMTSGFLSDEDQKGILSLLTESITSELATMLKEIGAAALLKRFDGENKARLKELAEFQEDILGFPGEKWSPTGVMEVLFRHGDAHIVETILDKGITVIRFETAFDTWEYDDGRVEEDELKGLRGNTDPDTNEIRIRRSLSNEEAATTLFHEVSHTTSPEPEYLEQEIQVRVTTEEFRIRHGLPPSKPGYRRADGTVDEAFIRKEMEGSPHYNPTGRTRIARRYEGEEEIKGWHLP